MTPTTLQFPIPQSVLDEKRALLALHGFQFPGDSGSGTFKSISFDYSYSSGVLTLTITKKPTLIPMSMVRSKLEQWMGVPSQES